MRTATSRWWEFIFLYILWTYPNEQEIWITKFLFPSLPEQLENCSGCFQIKATEVLLGSTRELRQILSAGRTRIYHLH